MTVRVGNLLRHRLQDAQMSQVDAAKQLGCSAKHLNQILQGHASLSIELAVGFEKMLSEPGLAHEVLTLQVDAELEVRGLTAKA